ncbi:MAG TPA: hypothetical protein VHL14_07915 [Steroidobacteraceae bacterium]|jgi:hypothetical protein|nr:hypothetical protein [Steroidobacteraceae bacterium]
MKVALSACLMALSVSFAVSAMADCPYPKMPADPPSGATATKEEMIAAKKVTTQYSNDMLEYLKCLDDEANSAVAALGADHKPEQEEPIKNKRDLKYDAAEKTMQKYVDSFNSELRAYKAKQAQ